MTPRRAGILLAVAHAALMGAIGAKLLAERARLPRAWARTLPYDPDLPIRGRYVRLQLELPLDSTPDSVAAWETRTARLEARSGRLAGVLDSTGGRLVRFDGGREGRAVLAAPVAYFIPEHIPDPSVRPPGEELWAEVTIPHDGAPRPIRLGVRKAGRLTPLDLR